MWGSGGGHLDLGGGEWEAEVGERLLSLEDVRMGRCSQADEAGKVSQRARTKL